MVDYGVVGEVEIDLVIIRIWYFLFRGQRETSDGNGGSLLKIIVTTPPIINCTRHALIVENIKIAFLRTKTAGINVMLPCQQNNNKSFYFDNVHILKWWNSCIIQ